MTPPKLIAFYLSQFHPTPENDRWWGKGFTEWTNVTKATPQFEGHLQPHLPTELGFYDLRVTETRRDQINTAKAYGIDGFCYHYYWFSGHRILNIPLDDMLADAESDMPFCLCWANENWTRRWDAAEHEILIAQKYLPDDDINFIKSLIPFFEDGRYIRVDGKPFLIVYRPQHLPDACKTLAIWRQHCRTIGLGEIHLCAALTHGNDNYKKYGFDSGVEFPPHNLGLTNINEQINFHHAFKGNVFQYANVAQSYLDRTYDTQNANIFKTVFPSWDNTARTHERALVILNGVPDNYEFWLSSAIDMAQQHATPLVFINAWNEWAEGCHLEPDRFFGNGFLQATRSAKQGQRRFSHFPATGVPSTATRTFRNEAAALIKYHACAVFSGIKEAIKRRRRLHKLLFPVVTFLRGILGRHSK